MFVPCKSSKPRVVFKARAYLSRASGAPLQDGLLALSTNIRLGLKCLPGTNARA